MGLYNIIFGENDHGAFILSALGFKFYSDVGRYRDCGVANGEIYIYTRNGGGNRVCITTFDDEPYKPSQIDCNAPDCYACIIQHRLPKHPFYLRDEDDDFDSTYATVYFRFPPELTDEFTKLDSGQEWNPSQRWTEFLDKLRTS